MRGDFFCLLRPGYRTCDLAGTDPLGYGPAVCPLLALLQFLRCLWRRLPALALLPLVAACGTAPERTVPATWELVPEAAHARTLRELPLRTGQILVSESGSTQALLLSLLLDRPQRHVHAAFLAVEDGEPVVYEATAMVRFSLTGSPADAVSGGVRRVSFADFVRGQREVAIYEPPYGLDVDAALAYARAALESGLRFDAHFRGTEPDRVYCSSFVARALEAGGVPPTAARPIHHAPSVRLLLDELGIEAREVIPADAFAEPERRLARISLHHAPSQLAARDALTRELHERLGQGLDIDRLFRFSRFLGLGQRAELRSLRAELEEVATGTDALALDARVQALVDERFGEVAAATFGQAAVSPGGTAP